MDWVLWLTPILLFLVMYPLVITGCALETEGLATGVFTRTLVLHYESLPALGQTPVSSIEVKYELKHDGNVVPVHNVPVQNVTYDSSGLAEGTLPMPDVSAFSAVDSVICDCSVWLHRQAWGSASTLGPYTATAATKNAVIAFTLTYSAWPQPPGTPPDYADAGFQLTFDG